MAFPSCLILSLVYRYLGIFLMICAVSSIGVRANGRDRDLRDNCVIDPYNPNAHFVCPLLPNRTVLLLTYLSASSRSKRWSPVHQCSWDHAQISQNHKSDPRISFHSIRSEFEVCMAQLPIRSWLTMMIVLSTYGKGHLMLRFSLLVDSDLPMSG
jgi:hypothetical protein